MNSRKASASSSAEQRKGSERRRASASSTASSTSCSLSVTSSIEDTKDSGWPGSPIDRTRRYGFHRAATVLAKNVPTEGWNGGASVGGRSLPRPIWPSIRVQLPNTAKSSFVVPPYLSKQEQERCEVGGKLYSSPQAGRMMSSKTFKAKKRAKKGVGMHDTSMNITNKPVLPDEVDILDSWTPGQCFNPRPLYYTTKATYAGCFQSLTPGINTNGNHQYLPHFAGSIRVKNENTSQWQDVPAGRWGSGSVQLDQLRKGERLYVCPELNNQCFSEDMIRGMLLTDADRQDPAKNRSYVQCKKEMDDLKDS